MKKSSPLSDLIDKAIADRHAAYDAIAEICRQAFELMEGKPIPAELQQRYSKLSPDITLETRLSALRIYFRRNVQDPVRDQETLTVVQTISANVQPVVQSSFNPSSLGPHDRPLLPLPPEPEIDTREEKLRKAEAREAFRRWTGWLSHRDKSGSGGGGNGDGGGWLGN